VGYHHRMGQSVVSGIDFCSISIDDSELQNLVIISKIARHKTRRIHEIVIH
jgi:hypothetical protein